MDFDIAKRNDLPLEVYAFDQKEFINAGTVAYPDDSIQTITFIQNTNKLIQAKEIKVATDISAYGRYRYERFSDILPCGLGTNDFIYCLWKRSG
jgi:hypothetical protein